MTKYGLSMQTALSNKITTNKVQKIHPFKQKEVLTFMREDFFYAFCTNYSIFFV